MLGASNVVVVVVVVFGGEFEEAGDDDDDDDEKGTVRSCAEMAFAIFLKRRVGSARMKLFLLPFVKIPMRSERACLT